MCLAKSLYPKVCTHKAITVLIAGLKVLRKGLIGAFCSGLFVTNRIDAIAYQYSFG